MQRLCTVGWCEGRLLFLHGDQRDLHLDPAIGAQLSIRGQVPERADVNQQEPMPVDLEGAIWQNISLTERLSPNRVSQIGI